MNDFTFKRAGYGLETVLVWPAFTITNTRGPYGTTVHVHQPCPPVMEISLEQF